MIKLANKHGTEDICTAC